MEEALVTVIVPIYGVEEYLPSCIESIQRQTHRNLQIILVDDGSPDCCGQICGRYARKDSRIQVIHQPNGGVSAARNAGLDAAKGEYVCFVDGDDMAAENMVQRGLTALTAGPYDLCGWGMEVRENGSSRYVGRQRELRFVFRTERERARFFCRWFFTARTGWEVFNRMFRRPLIERFHLRFGEAFFAEDMDFTFRYLLHCRNFLLLPEPLYDYRVRGSSAMQTIARQTQTEQFLQILQRQRADLADEVPAKTLCVYEAVALSIFMGEPEKGESPGDRVRRMYETLKTCEGWEALREDARSAAENEAGMRRICGQPYRSLAAAFCRFLLDEDEERYTKKSRIYYRYLKLREYKQRLLHGRNPSG